jgi:1,4-dihydroxy-2-naphthoate octaprenyltransferase
LGFLIANVLWINEVPDVDADRRAGKQNLVARRGRENALQGYILLFIFAYAFVIICAFVLKQPLYLASLISSVIAIKGIRIASKNLTNTSQLIPANQSTILCYLTTGILLSIGALLPTH